MVRTIAAIVGGYIVIVLLVFGLGLAAYAGIGPENAYQEKSWHATTIIGLLTLVAGVFSAIVGGWLAGKIDSTLRGFRGLAGVLLVLGLGMAVLQTMQPAPPPRIEPVTMTLAMEHRRDHRDPAWVTWLLPVLGSVGVLVGGAGTRGKPAPMTS
jgi:undecaprenyl pyrophosphate phosphatase UppP